MKFMVSWKIHQDKKHDAIKLFSQMTTADDQQDAGDKIKLIGRWHDVASRSGVAICESDDAKALSAWALNWNIMLDVHVVPVLDDEEAREVGKKKFA